jgi:hypothetical protein
MLLIRQKLARKMYASPEKKFRPSIPVAVGCKAYVGSRLIAEIVSSNLSDGMDVSLLSLFCVSLVAFAMTR